LRSFLSPEFTGEEGELMKDVLKLMLNQETLRHLNGFSADALLPLQTQASICNICIPPTESPNCNPA
jgi:hypothetical protein